MRGQSCPFLVIEDFGTTGLKGDPRPSVLPGEGDGFFYFFHAEGKSGKGGTDGGRWGLGKYVFPMSSRIRTFFGVTVRSTGEKGGPGPLLMGQAVLVNHQYDGKPYQPDGWYSDPKSTDEPLPIEDAALLTSFCGTWNVTRKTEPGLSIVVPYLQDELTDRSVTAAWVRDYYVAIIEGDLVVEVVTPTETLLVKQDTIRDVVRDLPAADLGGPQEKAQLQQALELVEWGRHQKDPIPVDLPEAGKRPLWGRQLMSAESRLALREALEQDQRAVVRVPLRVSPTGGETTESYFDVLVADTPDSKSRPVFVRSGIHVSAVPTSPLHGKAALVLVRHQALAQMLGDAEGPAHTTWETGGTKFKGKYTYGPSWLAYIRRAPNEIVKMIYGEDEQDDFEAAADLFAVPSGTASGGAEGGKKSPKGKGTPPPEPPAPKPPLVEVTRIESGFKLALTKAGKDSITSVSAQMAYSVTRGNPLKRWSEDDFDLNDDIDVELKGAQVVTRGGNQLVVAVDDSELFEVRVTGFDTRRDLYISTDTRVSEASE